MVQYTVDEIKQIMQARARVRNIAVVAHVDHGKTTLTDTLGASAGMIRREAAGDSLLTETRADERERGITIKSTGVSLCCTTATTQQPLLVNLIDSPGHVDFSSEVTAALRLTDGALVVVDVAEGPRVQTAAVLRQALAERVKPILVLNKFDRPFSERRDSEDVYAALRKAIESVNVLISAVDGGRWCVAPENGSVVFASAVQGWGFSLRGFAEKYALRAAKSGAVSVDTIAERMWGEWFFDEVTGRWGTSAMSEDGQRRLERGFCKLVMKPLSQVLELCTTGGGDGVAKLQQFTQERLNVRLTQEDLETLRTGDQRHRARAVL
jgi:elongation factor 2